MDVFPSSDYSNLATLRARYNRLEIEGLDIISSKHIHMRSGVPQPDNLSALAYRRISELDLGFNR